jgi:hypothetical protein
MTTASPARIEPISGLAGEYVERQAWKAGMLGAINTLTKVLAVRFAVLNAAAGGFVLAIYALSSPDLYKLGIIALYGVLVVLPVVWLAASGRG